MEAELADIDRQRAPLVNRLKLVKVRESGHHDQRAALAGAAFPATEQEATDYRDALVQRLVDDVGIMESDFEPLALDSAAAYEGVVGSMAEQVEKVSLAATGEDESRYAQHTLADMRANLNLAGGLAIYEAFSPWVAARRAARTSTPRCARASPGSRRAESLVERMVAAAVSIGIEIVP